MKTTQLTFITCVVILIAACSSSKKVSTSTAASPPATSTPLVLLKPSDGVYPPGEEELTAIQVRYKEVTLDQLKKGHEIYTTGACVNCHGTSNIYRYSETQWKDIIEDMGQRANITTTQKDAVYKYVLAIKATQAK